MKIDLKTYSVKCIRCNGSALILAVVISSLLAIVGVLFVMAAHINRMASSSMADNLELNYAVDSIIAQISQQLVYDVPGIAEPDKQHYYDFPDDNNAWLADLEPSKNGNNFYWRQTSDISGSPTSHNTNVKAVVVSDYDEIPTADPNNLTANADADGDGVGDSIWTTLNNINSGSGKTIYAAVRIIDNAAMINANTAYHIDTTDPNITPADVAGTNQLQINLMALTARDNSSYPAGKDAELLQTRTSQELGGEPDDLQSYLENVVWSYQGPRESWYAPFDISDELEIRYRYLLNQENIYTRLESWNSIFTNATLSTPVDNGGQSLNQWYNRARANYNLNQIDPNYSYRHITTIYSIDRIINPAGTVLNNGKMVNVNHADAALLFDAIRAGLREPNDIYADDLASQLAVNIVDYRDNDIDITTFVHGGKTYYGFEAQPFINDIAFKISEDDADDNENNYFAIELYNPFDVEIPLSSFRLELRKDSNDVSNTIRLSPYVMAPHGRFLITSGPEATNEFDLASFIATGQIKQDPNLILAEFALISADPITYGLQQRYDVYLLRGSQDEPFYLDKQQTQDTWFDWGTIKDESQFYSRADTNWNIVYQNLVKGTNTLGLANGITAAARSYNLTASPNPFLTIGEIARVLTISPSTDPNDMLGTTMATEPNESQIRIDLANPAFSGLFQYLTVIDPTDHNQPAEETRVKGRININTAPWFVLAQLPWMPPSVAQAIVENRNTDGAFKSTGELMSRIPQMGMYATDPAYSDVDLDSWPDLTPSDGAVSDFEERDVIFSRISNLATVRSDIFTAYIVVRLGKNGPQKRVIAVLDRSLVAEPGDKIKILAIQPVPDPR